jgi:hypothetical protein
MTDANTSDLSPNQLVELFVNSDEKVRDTILARRDTNEVLIEQLAPMSFGPTLLTIARDARTNPETLVAIFPRGDQEVREAVLARPDVDAKLLEWVAPLAAGQDLLTIARHEQSAPETLVALFGHGEEQVRDAILLRDDLDPDVLRQVVPLAKDFELFLIAGDPHTPADALTLIAGGSSSAARDRAFSHDNFPREILLSTPTADLPPEALGMLLGELLTGAQRETAQDLLDGWTFTAGDLVFAAKLGDQLQGDLAAIVHGAEGRGITNFLDAAFSGHSMAGLIINGKDEGRAGLLAALATNPRFLSHALSGTKLGNLDDDLKATIGQVLSPREFTEFMALEDKDLTVRQAFAVARELPLARDAVAAIGRPEPLVVNGEVIVDLKDNYWQNWPQPKAVPAEVAQVVEDLAEVVLAKQAEAIVAAALQAEAVTVAEVPVVEAAQVSGTLEELVTDADRREASSLLGAEADAAERYEVAVQIAEARLAQEIGLVEAAERAAAVALNANQADLANARQRQRV